MLLLCMFYCPLTKDEIKELLLLVAMYGLVHTRSVRSRMRST